MTANRAREAVRRQRFEREETRIPARIGLANGTVDVPGRRNYIYVTFLDGASAQALNMRVPALWGSEVLVGYDRLNYPNRLQVLAAWDVHNDPQWTGTPYHASTHQWPQQDTVFALAEQMLPGLVVPVAGALSVQVYPGPLLGTTTWKVLTALQAVDVTASVPGSGARYTLLAADSTGALVLRDGTPAASRAALVDADIPMPLAGDTPLAALILEAGASQLVKTDTRKDIIDLRFLPPAPGIDRANVQTSTYALIASDTLTVFTGTGPITWSLPASAGTGKRYRIAHDGTGVLTLAADGTDLVRGAASVSLNPGDSLEITDYTAGRWA